MCIRSNRHPGAIQTAIPTSPAATARLIPRNGRNSYCLQYAARTSRVTMVCTGYNQSSGCRCHHTAELSADEKPIARKPSSSIRNPMKTTRGAIWAELLAFATGGSSDMFISSVGDHSINHSAVAAPSEPALISRVPADAGRRGAGPAFPPRPWPSRRI